jgi:dolichol-phosphate hexosyltransferase
MKKITLLVPCYNEEKSIGKVIDSVPKSKLKKAGYAIEILVIDNNCTDKTAEIAKKKGARVVEEKMKGKGNAIKRGFKSISKDTDYVVMVDGDNTYNPEEMLRLIEPLDSGFCDVVIGSRLEGKMNGHALSVSHRLANWFFTFITRKFYANANVTDTCTGYFAWTKRAINVLNGYIKSGGFAIEAEMITKMSRLGLHIYSVPITYSPRHEDTKSNLNPIGDGLKITQMLLKNINWKPEVR